jgi:hypothetical protein
MDSIMDSILDWTALDFKSAIQRLWTHARSNIVATLADPEISWQRKVCFTLVAIFLIQTIITSIYRRMN